MQDHGSEQHGSHLNTAFSGLEKISFQRGSRLKEIERWGFCKSALKSFVRLLRDSAFSECEGLRYAELNESLETVGGCFRDTGLVAVLVPASVVEIDCRAFQRCTRLARLEFAQGSRLRRVRDSAFADTPLAIKYELPVNRAWRTRLGGSELLHVVAIKYKITYLSRPAAYSFRDAIQLGPPDYRCLARERSCSRCCRRRTRRQK